jgi:NitT/TauT family transport system permease protein
MSQPSSKTTVQVLAWGKTPPSGSSFLKDLPILLGGLALFYALISLTHYWMTPESVKTHIDLQPSALPRYAMFSLLRIAIAYVCSLAFTLVYGYVAAYNASAERFMIPLLDTLQSIPVLSFLPPVMLAMVALFPSRHLGIELGSILLIFTGQVWNMTFSFYSSLKSIPREMHEVAEIYRWSWWQKLTQMELPYSVIGLIWNSMMSVAGGWFFLMACEMFTLGDRNLRLPGLGSYLQTAANDGNTGAIIWGLAVMIGIVILIDQVVWRPAIAWAEKFKFEQVESAGVPRSPVLEFFRHSRILPLIAQVSIRPASEYLRLYFAGKHTSAPEEHPPSGIRKWFTTGILVVFLLAIAYAVARMSILLTGLSVPDLRRITWGAGATFLRVELTLILAGLWTIPVGVMIGLKPRLAAIAQPLAQIAASVPATALFPIILLMLIRAGGGLGIGSMVLLLLGTQWYILFNVIAGASAIPTDLKEVCNAFHYGRVERWRQLILPAIFPYLITGFVTASGGAWNASIIAEYFRFREHTYSITGLGAVISRATDDGDFRVLIAATIVMAVMVVTINRLVWRRLYKLASSRYTLET